MATAALEHFAKRDAHAAQYALIANSLLATAVAYLEKKETQERLRRTESSAQLFGLLPSGILRSSPELTRKVAMAAATSSSSGGSSPQKSGTGLGSGGTVEKREGLAPQGSSDHHQQQQQHPHHGGGTGQDTGSSQHPPGTLPALTPGGMMGMGSPLFHDLVDPAFLTMSSHSLPRTPDLALMDSMFDADETSFGGLNLFPLLDGTGGGGGHIDLAHYL